MQDINTPDTDTLPEDTEAKNEQPAEKEAPSAEDKPVPKLSQQEAEERMAALFALASSQNPKGKGKFSNISSKAIEILVLEVVSIILFFMTTSHGLPSAFSPIAVLLPAIVGVSLRILKDQLTLKEAFSECKAHIALSLFFLLCVILAFI